jgi:hypothetical protein
VHRAGSLAEAVGQTDSQTDRRFACVRRRLVTKNESKGEKANPIPTPKCTTDASKDSYLEAVSPCGLGDGQERLVRHRPDDHRIDHDASRLRLIRNLHIHHEGNEVLESTCNWIDELLPPPAHLESLDMAA